MSLGEELYQLVVRLWPINRSLTGDGVRQTLAVLNEHMPELSIHEIPTGTKCFDWEVPKEWNVREAWIADESGRRIVDYGKNNLHLVGYSVPIDIKLTLDELQPHLYSLPEQPDAIPYVTSYYRERWGFCMSHLQRQHLKPGQYHVHIDSSLSRGSLTYGEWYLPGESKREVLLSTYICHPSMANNELSGPVVVSQLAKWLKTLERRRYSYRIVLVPETLGSICYISRHLDNLRKQVIAGFVVTCVGDNRDYSYLASRTGETYADRVARHVLRHIAPDFKQYNFLDRGSDERQYCSPGVDLPVVSIMRSKYGEYPEYHTSFDNLELVTPEGLEGGFKALQRALECMEHDVVPKCTITCEPQLGKRGLYPTLSTRESAYQVRTLTNLLAYADGHTSLLDVAERIKMPLWELVPLVRQLSDQGLLTVSDTV